jgi:tRNA pseudouridine38-40 synthase
MIKNFKLVVEYDGASYHGWQRQKNMRSIQGEIETAIGTMIGQKITLIGSGRTDAGVHALAQVANFHCDTELPPTTLLRGLNGLLTEDIIIKACSLMPDSFHARYDVKSKTYIYKILNQTLPIAIYRQYAWHIKKKLDLEAMRSAMSCIRGTHDFKAFEGAGSPRSDSIRSIKKAALIKKKDRYLLFEVTANGFLRFMVRNIVGTLVEVGLEKITSEKFREILLSKDRSQAGATAPPHGLFLKSVQY